MSEQADHNDTGLTLPRFLDRVAEQYAERDALIFRGEHWTYRRLRAEIHRAEKGLIALGAGKGTRVAVIMSSRPEWVVACCAAMSIGAIAIPLSTYEPAVKIEALLAHSDASIVVVEDQFLRHAFLDDLLAAHAGLVEASPMHLDPTLPYLRTVIHLGDAAGGSHLVGWDDFVCERPTLPDGFVASVEAAVHPMDDALVLYTSGTSGPSKGVIHTHRSVAVQFGRLPREFSLTREDVVWGTFPLFWSAGIAWLLGASLGAGATLLLQAWFDPAAAVDMIVQHGATVLTAPLPQMAELERILDQRSADLSAVRIVPRGTLAAHVDLPRDHPWSGASLGLTEALTIATSVPWDGPLELRETTHGRPLPGIRLKIIDPGTGEALGPGEFGEIALKGTTLMRGYHKAFPEAYLDKAGYFRTSDGGYLDNAGYLHWTGRMSEVLRVNEANVSPIEIESALYQVPGVRIATVLGMPDTANGERVVACVVPAAGVILTEDYVKTQLRERLASYKIPSQVLLVDESDLPMTSTGKPVLSDLRELVRLRTGSATGGREG
jgi:fatty-acyl-CoA synthase